VASQPLDDLTPQITDFGLARLLDGPSQTRTGAILGTPSYMAPEQCGIRGRPAGPAIDVYSLGAILYHLLTGTPPFHGETALEVLHQVRFLDPVSPRWLRPGLPRDLETICVKCLEKDPVRRYGSARALADDLERFLAGKPTLARPVGPLERAVRWSRRKPAVAGLLAAVVLSLLAGAAVSTWFALAARGQARQARMQADKAEQLAADLKVENERAVQERRRAERHLERARSLVDELTRVGLELDDVSALEATGVAHKPQVLLEKALKFYNDFLQDESTDPMVRLETARACQRVGWIRLTRGQYEEADRAYRQGIDLLKRLLGDDPENTNYLRELCHQHRNRGHVLRDWGRPAPARESYDQAIRLAERLLKGQPGAELRILLAGILVNSWPVLSDPAEQERRLNRALDLATSATRAFPKNSFFQAERAVCLESLAVTRFERGTNTYLTRTYAREVLAIRQKLPDKHMLARSYTNLGCMLARHSPQESEALYRKAIELLEPQVRLSPLRPALRFQLVKAQCGLADLLAPSSARWEEVERLNRQGLAHCERLVKDCPKEAGYTARLVWRCNCLGSLLTDRCRHDDALVLFRQALGLLPADPETNNNLAWALVTHPDSKRHSTGEALTLARKAVDARPKSANYHNTLGAAQYRAGAWKEAVVSLRVAMRLRGGGDAFDCYFLAMAYRRLDEVEQARAWYEQAEKKRTASQPKNDELLRLCAEARAVLARPAGR
jgi:tetratricopeptide (TPR) repeat protein